MAFSPSATALQPSALAWVLVSSSARPLKAWHVSLRWLASCVPPCSWVSPSLRLLHLLAWLQASCSKKRAFNTKPPLLRLETYEQRLLLSCSGRRVPSTGRWQLPFASQELWHRLVSDPVLNHPYCLRNVRHSEV